MTAQPPDLRSELARVLALYDKAVSATSKTVVMASHEYTRAADNFFERHGQSLAALVEDAWQPIETAPNDVDILVFRDDLSMEHIPARDNDYRWQPPPHKPTAGITCPTHWRPMPPPPPAARNSTGDASHE